VHKYKMLLFMVDIFNKIRIVCLALFLTTSLASFLRGKPCFQILSRRLRDVSLKNIEIETCRVRFQKTQNRTLNVKDSINKIGNRTLSVQTCIDKIRNRTLSFQTRIDKIGNRTLSVQTRILKTRNRKSNS